MKIQVDNQDVFELAKWQEDVIKNDIPSEIFTEDMKRRARYIWEHKFERCFERLEKEWLPKLQADPNVASIPTSKELFVKMIFERPDYKNRSQRDAAASNN